MNNIENKCLKAGVELTANNKLILSTLMSFEEHPTVEDIYLKASSEDKSLKIEVVYRLLERLHDCNIIKRYEFSEGYARYEVIHDHHHLFDLDTGELIECDLKDIESLKTKAKQH